jgi:hypothetical protein
MSTSPHTLNLLETKGIQMNALVQEMNETFPPINPNPSQPIEQIMYQAGQRDVVEWFINKLQD